MKKSATFFPNVTRNSVTARTSITPILKTHLRPTAIPSPSQPPPTCCHTRQASNQAVTRSEPQPPPQWQTTSPCLASSPLSVRQAWMPNICCDAATSTVLGSAHCLLVLGHHAKNTSGERIAAAVPLAMWEPWPGTLGHWQPLESWGMLGCRRDSLSRLMCSLKSVWQRRAGVRPPAATLHHWQTLTVMQARKQMVLLSPQWRRWSGMQKAWRGRCMEPPWTLRSWV